MYKVTKQVINSKGNIMSTSDIMFINANQSEIESSIAIKFKKLADCETLKYKLIGSDNIVKYTLTYIYTTDIDMIDYFINESVHTAVDNINTSIKARNAITRNGNKKYGRNLNSNIVDEVNSSYYLNPFYGSKDDITSVGKDSYVLGDGLSVKSGEFENIEEH